MSGHTPKRLLRELAVGAVDLLFPPRCLTCNALAPPFCEACAAAIRPLSPAQLPLPPGILAARCVGQYEGPLRDAVLRLKFSQKTALAASLGDLLAEALRAELPAWSPDLLTPVPIHWRRRWNRGFNQSELLGQQVRRRLKIPVVEVLRRIRYTPPQVGLTRALRASNLRNAFAVTRPDRIAGQRVVLVDDVWTTGATLAECAAVLTAAGAVTVYALTVTHEPD